MRPLISYTLPCHKRQADLVRALPSVLAAAAVSPPVEIVVVDYGNPAPLQIDGVQMVRVARDYFHMAHARNVGIRAASGVIVCAFLADQVLAPNFFQMVRDQMQSGVFLRWQETFVAYRSDLLEAGGFDERFEYYGPEGKELRDRLERRGLTSHRISDACVWQIPTRHRDKLRHYRDRASLTKRQMHHIGRAIWDENTAAGVLVANAGQDWGAIEARAYAHA